MSAIEKLVELLLSDEGPAQGLALVDALRDELDWDELFASVTVSGPPLTQRPRTAEDSAGFRGLQQLTLGRFEPAQRYVSGVVAERTNMVLRLLCLAPPDLEVRRAEAFWLDGGEGVVDADALVRAFPHVRYLLLARCQLDDWNQLSRLPLRQLRLYRGRRFAATKPMSCVRLGVSETAIHGGRSFGAVTDLTTRGGILPKALRSFGSLRSIRCLGWSGCTNDLLTEMAELPELEVINVDGTIQETVRGVSPPQYLGADLAVFAATPKLRELRLRRTRIDPTRLHRLVGHPALETLELDLKWRRQIPKQVRRDLPFE